MVRGGTIVVIAIVVACGSTRETAPSSQLAVGSGAPSSPAAVGSGAASTDGGKLRSGTLGVEIDAPAGARVDESASSVFVVKDDFKLNLFPVDQYSAQTAAAQKARIESEPGFVRFTLEQDRGQAWRFDYQLERGKAATLSRINAGRALDCGVYGVTPETAATVAAACATVGVSEPAARRR